MTSTYLANRPQPSNGRLVSYSPTRMGNIKITSGPAIPGINVGGPLVVSGVFLLSFGGKTVMMGIAWDVSVVIAAPAAQMEPLLSDVPYSRLRPFIILCFIRVFTWSPPPFHCIHRPRLSHDLVQFRLHY